MADHGEEFQDHGAWLHGRSVFDELVRIPLIVKFPGQQGAGRRIQQQVQAVDVLPTILENEGLPVPPSPAIAGLPLQGVLSGAAARATRGLGDQPPRLRRPWDANGEGQVRPPLQPRDRRALLRPVHDPKELVNRIDEARDRARTLKASVEAAMVPNPFRYSVRVTGSGDHVLTLSTGGWLEGVQATGLGPRESATLEANGRRLVLRLAPRPGQPREVAFGLRPLGVRVELSGTRGGRPLQPGEVWIAEDGAHPGSVPVELPDPEGERARTGSLFSPPPASKDGVAVWLTMTSGRQVLELDKEAQERLKALGYLGPN